MAAHQHSNTAPLLRNRSSNSSDDVGTISGPSKPVLPNEEQSVEPQQDGPWYVPGEALNEDNNRADATGRPRGLQRMISQDERYIDGAEDDIGQGRYRVYKRRWFGLAQLVLLNIVVSWDWLTFSAVSSTSAEWFEVDGSAINWLSTAFLFAFVLASPVVLYTLHRGVRPALLASSVLIFCGSWIRYGGSRSPPSTRFGVSMFGQILIGLAQPFVLSAPTRYSALWFTEKGRVSATAVASLANPLGGALAQLIGPFWATRREEVPNLVLYTAIISSAAALPSLFIPKAPPSAPSSRSILIPRTSLRKSMDLLLRTPPFWALGIAFAIYVALFNSFSSLLNQILSPYNFSEEEAGITGALLIIVGLVTSAISSPLVDRLPVGGRGRIRVIKCLVPLVAVGYLIFVFAPGTRAVAAPYAIAAILGASSFSLVPIALEELVHVTSPASPEISSTLCWTGGQLLGALFILIEDVLQGGPLTPGQTRYEGGDLLKGEPEGSMLRALVFQAIVAWAAVPLVMMLGWRWFELREGRPTGDEDEWERGDRSED